MFSEDFNEKKVLLKSLIEEWGGEEAFLRMKRSYTNKRLEEMLYNKGQLFVEWNNRLIRKTTPIFQEPQSRLGRAQFFAPEKNLGKLSIDTYWFNLLIIWISSLLYYLTLVYDLLRKFTNWNRIRKLQRP